MAESEKTLGTTEVISAVAADPAAASTSAGVLAVSAGDLAVEDLGSAESFAAFVEAAATSHRIERSIGPAWRFKKINRGRSNDAYHARVSNPQVFHGPPTVWSQSMTRLNDLQPVQREHHEPIMEKPKWELLQT